MFEIVKNYRDNDKLRKSFGRLAEKTFGLVFEDWYQNGYWSGKYIPYSIVKDGEVAANVSVNRMDMRLNGQIRHLIQLGTVMTDVEYRNQGLIRKLMEEIEADYAGKTDGMYLFANDSVLTFYPKFGYRKAEEWQCFKEVRIAEDSTVENVPMRSREEWNRLTGIICQSRFCGQFDMADNKELIMFYVTKFMQDAVYYEKKQDAYMIAEVTDGELLLHGIFSEHEVNMDGIINAFGSEVKKVVLGFTPKDITGWQTEKVQESDCTLFAKGAFFEDFERQQVMFPTLSHA